jgi:hypothetical protein
MRDLLGRPGGSARRALPTASILLTLMLLGACDGGRATPPDRLGGRFEYCERNAECQSGYCLLSAIGGRCSLPCTSTSECDPATTGTQCGLGPDGTMACVPACGAPDSGYACVDGVSVACERVDDDRQCLACGCDPSLRCEPGVGCLAKSEVGGNCRQDSDCRTGNCSTFAGVCRVPVGQACTANDCDRCLTAAGGWSYCSRECDDVEQCNGDQCLGSPETGFFTCRPGCTSFGDASCPGTCQYPSDGGELFCACDYQTCPTVEPPRQVGQPCYSDSHCATGACYAHRECGGPFKDECIDRGVCTQACESDASCGAGNTCVAVPCVEGQTTECGKLCLPTCSDAEPCDAYTFCVARPAAGGATAMVCDARQPEGASCWSGLDCQSGKCIDRRCAPAGGQANGAACGGPADCLSQSCVSGTCRGTALLGDSCTIPPDCAAGTCCTSGPQAGTCRTSC